jgi:maltooligosyltrehalose trehalohydrolase
MRDWQPTLGALWDGQITSFRVWAPNRRSVDLILVRDAAAPRPLTSEANGYWTGAFDDIRPGDLYRFRLNADDARTFPDPASRFQPFGVHGPSEVIDPRAFTWSDTSWHLPDLRDLVFYELHVGTFTPAGSFRGAIDRLDHLASLGITAVELMPVGDCAGDRNWGYDVAAPFAPLHAYGRPDDLRALVDAAHHRNLSVFLDVVYNHVGPDGAYAPAYSDAFFNPTHQSPWGPAINLDGEGASEVRRYFIENAVQWLNDYHVDGLRLDATHALIDDSPRHFLVELADVVHTHSGRRAHLVAEDHRNLASLLLPPSRGGFGIDGVWADDFHHQARVHTAHDDESYYADYSGTAADLARTIRDGWFYSGQVASSTGRPRGSDPSAVSPAQCIVCIQNHDQIGNRADGARLTEHVDLATFRALSALLLLVPETPLLFMGQEWAATSPFLFFTDYSPELGAKITEGRRSEFSAFRAFADPAQRATIPDPQARDTFERSRLAWNEALTSPHREVLALYRDLLALRRALKPGHLSKQQFDVQAPDEHTIALGLPGVTVVARLSGSGVVRVERGMAAPILTTEDPGVAHDPAPLCIEGNAITFARPGAVILSTSLALRSSIARNRS